MVTTATADTNPKREAILAAALALFAERGFDGTSVPLVAKEAGVGAGTIYRYFESKEALVNALYRKWKTVLMGALLDGFDFDGEPREQFHELWARLARFVHEHPRAFAFLELHHHQPYLDEESLALEERSLMPVFHFLEQTRARGVTRDAPSEALIAMVWGAFVGLVKAVRLGHLELTDEVLDSTEACMWDAIT
jgi:AcrR family transcriptional regulator